MGNDVLISVDNNAIIVEINIDKDQTVILNNIKFNFNFIFTFFSYLAVFLLNFAEIL